MRFSEISKADGSMEWLIRKDGCMHCEDPGCLKACPAPGAIVKYANGIVDFISENCIGCGYCIAGCPFNIPRISKTDTRLQVLVVFGSRERRAGAGLREDLPHRRHPVRREGGHAHSRREAGERPEGARLPERRRVRPQGVGGTHVMYVLQHADKPELYHNLPNDPKISPWVSLWKGIAKPLLALVAGLQSSARSSTTSRVVRRKWTTRNTEAEPWLSS